MQLSLILLPGSIREEIVRLLVFMKLCCDDDSPQLSATVSTTHKFRSVVSSSTQQ